MTKGPWKYQKAYGHHHVLFPNGEVLDVQNEDDARAIASLPDRARSCQKIAKEVDRLDELLLLDEDLADAWGEIKKIVDNIRTHLK